MLHWITPFGWPDLVISDQGPEFVGHEFNETLGEHGVLDHKIDAQSPWQNGRTERAGAEVKEMVEKIVRDKAVTNLEELDYIVASAVSARNRYRNRSGFSAHQRVFGSS